MVHYVRNFNANYSRARKQEYGGRLYDSGFEAEYAQHLDLMLKAGEIKAWEPQYKVEMWSYTKDGQPFEKKSHRIDFRVELHDGSFELIETKGVETDDWRKRRKWLEKLWLPEHPDHTYTVVKRGKSYYPGSRKVR